MRYAPIRRSCFLPALMVSLWCPLAASAQAPQSPPQSFEQSSLEEQASAPPPFPGGVCPVMPSKQVDEDYFVDYEGERVYFCCRNCRRRFNKEPMRYLNRSTQLASLKTGVQGYAEDHNTNGLFATVGKFHLPAVHFPIALLLAAALAELLWIKTGQSLYANAVCFTVCLGSLGAIGTGLLGWCAAGLAWSDGDWLMTTHRWLGTGIAVWAILLLKLNAPVADAGDKSSDRSLFRFFLFTGAIAVSANGFFGGALEHGLDHLPLPW